VSKRRIAPRALMLVVALGAVGASPSARASCGAAFCSLNTQWDAQGVWTDSGWRVDLRYEYIDQNQLRSGRNETEPAGVPDTHDEIRTLSRNLLVGVDYTVNKSWGMSLLVPLIQRDHNHIYNDVAPEEESWKFRSVGDLRVLGRYRAPFENAAAGVQFGLKLPTGKFDETNDAGEAAERTLQPGTGTIDTLLGLYYHRSPAGSDTTLFTQALWQRPLDERDGYAPGQRLSFDLGLRYAMTHTASAQLQLNFLWKGRDAGINAEPDDTGGRYLFISPGLSYLLGTNTQLYGFVQLPLYQYVNGTQLTADWAAVAGFSWKL
jgi:hypothetical protein